VLLHCARTALPPGTHPRPALPPCLPFTLCFVLCVCADMVQRGCERNVITYSSLISACEKAGRCELALQLFERMHKEGCTPNVVTYNSLIAACSHGECVCVAPLQCRLRLCTLLCINQDTHGQELQRNMSAACEHPCSVIPGHTVP
jgi:pentatricopeptide repeat protein